MRFIRFMCLSVLLAAVALPIAESRAETYEQPSLKNIFRTLIRYGAVDIYDDDIIDVYARTNECEVFKDHFKDVFKWEKIRQKLRETIKQDAVIYPTGYRYDTTLKLGRYDFKKQNFPFDQSINQKNVNVFVMQTHAGDYCNSGKLNDFPTAFKLVLDKTVGLEGLELNEEQGKELFDRMNEANNVAHLVYARFNIRVMYVASLASSEERRLRGSSSGAKNVAKVQQNVQYDTVGLDSRLDSIEYFEDAARTKLIYVQRL